MKKYILILIAAMLLISCQKENIIGDKSSDTQEVVYKVTGDRLTYQLTVADQNGEEKYMGYFNNTDSVVVHSFVGAAVWMELECSGYGDYEIELLINGERRDYFLGHLENRDVIFLNY